MIWSVGSIYSIHYTQWRTNYKAYILVLYAGPTSSGNKLHALNLAAIQLSTIDKIRLFTIIRKLSKLPASSTYTGRILYRIFRQYAYQTIKKCYRTYWLKWISAASIINYGLNDPATVPDIAKRFQNTQMFTLAQKDLLKKSMDLFIRRAVTIKDLTAGFATASIDPTPAEAEKIVDDKDSETGGGGETPPDDTGGYY